MKTVLLGDVCISVISGGTPRTSNESYWNGKISWLNSGETRQRYIDKTEKTITEDGVVNSSTRKALKGSTVIASAGQGKTRGQASYLNIDTYINQSIIELRPDPEKIDSKYLFFYLSSLYERLRVLSDAESVRGSLTTKILSKLEIDIPSIQHQQAIGKILGDIDEKIELNWQMNETQEQIGQALFRHCFIDSPAAKKWEKRELGEFFPIKTGKKDANFGVDDGEYPFFTCAQTISKAPDYSFNAHALLLAGNGDFNLKLYRGKFEAYQRTYVLVPHNEKLVGILYFLMMRKLSEITGGSRGSVIKFITKGMIENYKIALPDDEKLVEMAGIFNQLTVNIEENVKQIQTLTSLRDALLPRLISGKIKL